MNEFYKVSILYRELIKELGPAGMPDALVCLHGMVNATATKLNSIGQHKAKDMVGEAWLHIYDASKAIEP